MKSAGASFSFDPATRWLACVASALLAASCLDLRDIPPPLEETKVDGGGGSGGGMRGNPSPDGPPTPSEGTTCPEGFHTCGGKCVDNTSVNSCGLACEPCPGVQGGSAVCMGGRCAVTCPAGQKPCQDKCVPVDTVCEGCPAGKNECGGICVEATSRTACGSACAVCPTSDHGVTSCDGDKCQLKCDPGYHSCNDVCVSDLRPESCGASCSPCSVPIGGKATCNAGKCGAECPSGKKLCLDACIPMNDPCNGVCPEGKRNCDGMCVPKNDVNFCGPSCSPCRAPENGEAGCENDSCTFSCRSGFHKCGDVCADSRSVDSCGDSCGRCSTPANGSPTCDGNRCGIRCNSGFHDCDGVCKSNNDVASCGGRCQRCPDPPGGGGVAVCRDGQCAFECTGGRRECNGRCIGPNEPCGMSCPNDLKFCSNTGTCKARNQCCESCSATGCNSSTGECNACRPNEASCPNSTTLRKCRADGSRTDDMPCLPAQTNETGTCAGNRCDSVCNAEPGKSCGDGKCWRLEYGCQECQNGFIWRDLRPGDQICVTGEEVQTLRRQEREHPMFVEPDPALRFFGPNTCIQNWVWRDAVAGDEICVTGPERDEAARQRTRHRDRTRVGNEQPR
jgi:hypothetical protein